jgi:outer membrane protein TolC
VYAAKPQSAKPLGGNFMSDNRTTRPAANHELGEAQLKPGRGSDWLARSALIWLCLFASFARAQQTLPATNVFTSQPLSLTETINIALQQNPHIVRAQKDVAAAQGVVVQTRAIAFPKLQAAGSYSGVQSTDVDMPRVAIANFSFGTEQAWASQIRLVQSLYQGGHILSSLRVAKLTRERSLLMYQTAVADTVLEVQLAYYDVLLAAQEIIVQEKSVELLGSELADTKRRYDAGTVP